MTRPRTLCLSCLAAALAGDPPCCAEIDLVPISPFVDADRYTWWAARMATRTLEERAAISATAYDRGRCYAALHQRARGRGGFMVFAAAER